jgi:hypothetical protein
MKGMGDGPGTGTDGDYERHAERTALDAGLDAVGPRDPFGRENGGGLAGGQELSNGQPHEPVAELGREIQVVKRDEGDGPLAADVGVDMFEQLQLPAEVERAGGSSKSSRRGFRTST